MQDWFNVSERLKFSLGLELDQSQPARHPEMNSSLPNQHGGYCLICYDAIEGSNSFALNCGHTFCRACWVDYLKEKVRSGFHGIDALCMQANCNVKVTHTSFESLLQESPKDKETYWKWLCKSFTDDNKNIKWCPNLQCEFCVERLDLGKMLYEVVCDCGTEFCFICGNFTHKPCDCETATKWSAKANAESENVNWIVANTKPCPKC